MKKRAILPISFLLNTILFQAQTGNIGINTPDPGSTLTVNGSFAAKYRTVSVNTMIILYCLQRGKQWCFNSACSIERIRKFYWQDLSL